MRKPLLRKASARGGDTCMSCGLDDMVRRELYSSRRKTPVPKKFVFSPRFNTHTRRVGVRAL